MKIKIAFTLDIPPNSIQALRELSQANNDADVRDFFRQEAKDHLWEYMTYNGVNGVTVKMQDI